MKKLYLLLVACATAAGMNAANLKFYVAGQEVTPGSTVNFTDIQAEEYEPGVWDIIMNPKVAVASDFVIGDVSVTAECTSGHSIQMCAGGQCEAGAKVTKTGLVLYKDQPLSLDFEFMNQEYEGNSVPQITTKFTASAEGCKTIEFTLVMGKDGASVSAPGADSYVRFNGSAIAYSVSGTQQFALYSLTGVCALSTAIEGTGSISTAALPKGVYIYRAGSHTGRVLIR